MKNRYGFGWLQNDKSYGVTVRNLTLDIATGNVIRLYEHAHVNEMENLEMIGKQRRIYNDGSWLVTPGIPELPRLTERLKRRVTEATRRADVTTKVLA